MRPLPIQIHLPHALRLLRLVGFAPPGFFYWRLPVTKETYLKPREAAEYLRSSTSTLAKARMYKRGPNFVRIGRAIRYRQSDLDAWMSASVAQQAELPGRAATTGPGEG